MTSESVQFELSCDDVLYSFDKQEQSLSQKIMNNLNKIT